MSFAIIVTSLIRNLVQMGIVLDTVTHSHSVQHESLIEYLSIRVVHHSITIRLVSFHISFPFITVSIHIDHTFLLYNDFLHIRSFPFRNGNTMLFHISNNENAHIPGRCDLSSPYSTFNYTIIYTSFRVIANKVFPVALKEERSHILFPIATTCLHPF